MSYLNFLFLKIQTCIKWNMITSLTTFPSYCLKSHSTASPQFHVFFFFLITHLEEGLVVCGIFRRWFLCLRIQLHSGRGHCHDYWRISCIDVVQRLFPNYLWLVNKRLSSQWVGRGDRKVGLLILAKGPRKRAREGVERQVRVQETEVWEAGRGRRRKSAWGQVWGVVTKGVHHEGTHETEQARASTELEVTWGMCWDVDSLEG